MHPPPPCIIAVHGSAHSNNISNNNKTENDVVVVVFFGIHPSRRHEWRAISTASWCFVPPSHHCGADKGEKPTSSAFLGLISKTL
jgi:hypothetical protein